MSEVRAALLIAAEAHLARRPWSAVRMGEVAASAGVSRQTLYNEFGSKEGLARALARQAADGYLAGIERALARSAADPRERLRAAADWTVAAARPGTLLRSLLTGCWGDPLPA
ncbi:MULTISPECIES: TetR/AcrR family transcriptional regulator, partial [unclassified Streptomyces]